MTSDTNLRSRTVWGTGIFLLVSALQAVGWLPDANWVVEGVKWLSGLAGISGFRDALR